MLLQVRLYTVICSSYAHPLGAEAPCCTRFGQGPSRQPLVWDLVRCSGRESNLAECSRSIRSTCGHNADASVICSLVKTCDNNHRALCTHMSTECPEENMFPCSESPPDNPVCVSELQFCDGIADCPGGSDEPADCARGQATCEVKIVFIYK